MIRISVELTNGDTATWLAENFLIVDRALTWQGEGVEISLDPDEIASLVITSASVQPAAPALLAAYAEACKELLYMGLEDSKPEKILRAAIAQAKGVAGGYFVSVRKLEMLPTLLAACRDKLPCSLSNPDFPADLEMIAGMLAEYGFDETARDLRTKAATIRAAITAAEGDTPTKPPTEDEVAFGQGVFVYCNQHLKPHLTGWCSVSNREKIGLGTSNAKEALQKCREWGLRLVGHLEGE